MNNVAATKLNGIIEKGRVLAQAGMEALAREYQFRNDFIARADAVDVEFQVVKDGVAELATAESRGAKMTLQVKSGDTRMAYGLTDHARSQLLTRAGIPGGFADFLESKGQYGLLRENVQRLVPVVSKEGVLVREVNGLAKGILSPSYKRLDASPLFEAYASASLRMGYVPYTGEVTDTRAFLSFIGQDIIEPFPGEYLVVGTELRTSDYGRGAFQLALSVLRLLCTNGLIGNDILRKVHLGRRFDTSEYEGSVIQLSKRTMELDAATVRSALLDTFKTIPARQEELVKNLQLAAGKELNLRAALDGLRKKLPKETVERVKTTYENTALPVEAVPQEPGRWRFSQVLSLLANSEKNADAAADLRDVAFEALAA